ncbi:MAG: 2-vinyl bacteriochlorophyllide hydratase [Caulobacterales bacterium]|jgi:3-vinyl bacteriochlorophyllide hydratase
MTANPSIQVRRAAPRRRTGASLGDWFEALAASPWPASSGARPVRARPAKPLYTAEERARRDASPWTIVQAALAPLQFLVFAVSLVLVVRYLETGQGYALATASIIAKTIALYAIMITGSIWEKDVFGKWLFAPAFFWEDVFSFLVLGLQTLYLAALAFGWWSPEQQMLIAIAAYGAYVINAGQFLWKLRQARLEGAGPTQGLRT